MTVDDKASFIRTDNKLRSTEKGIGHMMAISAVLALFLAFQGDPITTTTSSFCTSL